MSHGDVLGEGLGGDRFHLIHHIKSSTNSEIGSTIVLDGWAMFYLQRLEQLVKNRLSWTE